jgi:hypothetical protein
MPKKLRGGYTDTWTDTGDAQTDTGGYRQTQVDTQTDTGDAHKRQDAVISLRLFFFQISKCAKN